MRIIFALLALLWSSQAYALGAASAGRMAAAYQPGTLAQLWAGTAKTNGGSPTNTRIGLVKTFFASDQLCGSFYATDDMLLVAGEDAPSGLTSLKQRTLSTVTAAPTFTASKGYAFNGTSQFLSWTGTAPASLGHTNPSNGRIGEYEITNVNSNTVGMGATPTWVMRARGSSGVTAGISNTAANVALASGTSIGYTVATRSAGSTTMTVYKIGSNIGTATVTPSGVAAAIIFFIGARNNAGTADSVPRQLRFMG